METNICKKSDQVVIIKGKRLNLLQCDNLAHPVILLLDDERTLVLDAMALLGGNEYLVQQMIDRLCETNYR